MQAPPTSRILIFNLIIVTVCAALAGGGYWAGRRGVIAALESPPSGHGRTDLSAVRDGLVYGELIDPSTHDAAANAYFDREAAKASLDVYGWTPPQVLAPFVGSAAQHGQGNNISINLQTIRSSRPLAIPKPAGVVRVFATGASVLFSSGASSNEQTICAHLEKILNDELGGDGARFEVLCLANPGWATTHERIAIENRITEMEPDLVISLSSTADIIWGQRKQNVLWMRSDPERTYFNVVNKVLALTGYEPMVEVAWGEGKIVEPAKVAERLDWNVKLAHHALQLRGVPYVFFMQPALQLTEKPLSPREEYFVDKGVVDVPYYNQCADLIRAKLEAIADASFTFADMSSAFDGLSAEDEIFLDTYHLGDRGNQIIARAMFDAMESVARELK